MCPSIFRNLHPLEANEALGISGWMNSLITSLQLLRPISRHPLEVYCDSFHTDCRQVFLLIAEWTVKLNATLILTNNTDPYQQLWTLKCQHHSRHLAKHHFSPSFKILNLFRFKITWAAKRLNFFLKVPYYVLCIAHLLILSLTLSLRHPHAHPRWLSKSRIWIMITYMD